MTCAALSCHDACFAAAPSVYDECGTAGTCPPGLDCITAPLHCSFDCGGEDGNCPAPPPGGTAPAICSPELGVCILDCSNNRAVCPPGMSCLTFGPTDLCGY